MTHRGNSQPGKLTPLSPQADAYLTVFNAWLAAGMPHQDTPLVALKDITFIELAGRYARRLPGDGTNRLLRALARR